MIKIDSTVIYERNGNTLSIETFLDEEDFIVMVFSVGDATNGLHVFFNSMEVEVGYETAYEEAIALHKRAVKQNKALPGLESFMNILDTLEKETGDNPNNVMGHVTLDRNGTVQDITVYDILPEELESDEEKYWLSDTEFGVN